MIAITGANGQLGRRVIDSLLKQVDASELLALVRDTSKAEALRARGVAVRHADYDQPDTLDAALQGLGKQGVEKLLLISGTAYGRRVEQHQAVIQAAQRAGVGLLAYTSILRADTNPMRLAQEHRDTEALIQRSGVPAVLLRHPWYNENFSDNLAVVLASKQVAGCSENGRWHCASRQDLAEAAAAVLTATQPQAGKIYELAGDDGFTLQQYAQAVGAATGQTIHYQPLKPEELQQGLIAAGVPEDFAVTLADAEVYASEGWMADSSASLSRLIGRATTPIEHNIAAALDSQ
jgi:NAD(P)H dehydrogenase (quinone)